MITVKRDPQIEFPQIVTSLMETDKPGEGEMAVNTTQIRQTDVYSIMCPLLALNGVVVDMPDLLKFKLDCTDVLPRVEFEFRDRNNLFAQYCQPGTSNILQVQIIPSTDNTYRKINLIFYVTDIDITENIIGGEAVYKTEGLLNNKAHSLGEMSTYELCDRISAESHLGFASDIVSTDDKRFIYCDYKNYGDLLREEITNSLADKEHVYDCWVDMWNYIVLCNIFNRYNDLDEGDDLIMWAADHNTIGEIGGEVYPFRTEKILSNHPMMERSETFVRRYSIITDNQYVKRGTEKAVTVYNMKTKEYVGHYVADGDVKSDAFVNLEYGGEVYGDYDYIFSKQCRDMFLKKMKAEIIELSLTSPVFGISRGDQCRFVWLSNDPKDIYWQETLEKTKAIAKPQDIPTDDMSWLLSWYRSVSSTKADDLKPNLEISGQYTVIGIIAEFQNGVWDYKLRLVRPATRKPTIMIDLNENE